MYEKKKFQYQQEESNDFLQLCSGRKSIWSFDEDNCTISNQDAVLFIPFSTSYKVDTQHSCIEKETI